MKRLLFSILVMVVFSSMALASPVLTSDPASESEVDSCKIEGDGFNLPCAIDENKAVRVDLATLTKGRSYTITAKFCAQGGLWCSDPSDPFSFTVPNLGSRPTLQLSIQ